MRVSPSPQSPAPQFSMTSARWSLVAAAACIVLWIVLAFVAAIHSGWAHAPLAIGTVLIVKAIIDS